ncbi:MAG TPA: class I SAM-dependent methyltransferase [Pyrinomonadaceae bacterium]|nr:class I SAM-dependent methyltransferase [Pyrinomonadaceae bacterium]
MNTASSHLKRCRSCDAEDLRQILSLGRTPLANSLLRLDELQAPEETYPLDLLFCPACTLVQISETVPPEKLFRNYLYFSSYSDTMLEHAEQLTRRVTEAHGLDGQSLVLEVASNDGYLLQYYQRNGVPVLGIEPAVNIARVARERGIETLCEFFGRELAVRLKDDGIRADVIHANNVLAHVADLNGLVSGLPILLKDNGVAIIEVPYVKEMIDHCEFDTIYHEHLCYFSLTALNKLFRRHGLLITDVELLPIHGGSLRVFVAQQNATPPTDARQRISRVEEMLESEEHWGVAL